MKQETAVKFTSEDKKITIYADGDTALGSLHDFLLETKGTIVDRISAAQKQEADAAKKVKEQAEAKKAQEPQKAPEAEKPVEIK
jgi:uncharacterized protein YajQ (UPF0234 family)